jgi:hypothetical protein
MAVLDGERDIVDHRDSAISLGQAAQFNRRHANPPLIAPPAAALVIQRLLYQHRRRWSLAVLWFMTL